MYRSSEPDPILQVEAVHQEPPGRLVPRPCHEESDVVLQVGHGLQEGGDALQGQEPSGEEERGPVVTAVVSVVPAQRGPLGREEVGIHAVGDDGGVTGVDTVPAHGSVPYPARDEDHGPYPPEVVVLHLG